MAMDTPSGGSIPPVNHGFDDYITDLVRSRYYQPPDIAFHTRPLFHDPALTAFTQLGVIRLNAQRGVVNLTARNREWILSIVGKTRSVLDDGRSEDPDGNNWPTIGEKEMGLAQRNVELLCTKDSSGQVPPYLIVNDVRTDERYAGHPVIVNEPFVRFLAVFPLRTSSNIVIGTYMIVDDKPRDCTCPKDIDWLSNMAITVMEHLDSERVRRMQDRSERMIKAMGLFVEGKSTLREWWLSGGHRVQDSVVKNILKDGRTADDHADQLFGVQEPPNGFAVQGIQDLYERDANRRHSPVVATMNSKRPMPRGVSFHSSTSITDSTGEAKTSSEAWESNTDITTEDLQPPITPLPDAVMDSEPILSTPPDSAPDSAQGKRLQEALLTSDVKKAFARASNLIREAAVLEGCVYFDASIGSFGGGAQTSENAPPAFKLDGSSGGPSSSDDENRTPNIDALSGDDLNGTRPVEAVSRIDGHLQKEPEKCCNVLGFSTRTRSSVNSHEPSENMLSFPENLLRRFLKKYPHGKIMSFDKEGQFSSSDSDQVASSNANISSEKRNSIESHSSEKSKERRMSREAEFKAVQAAFPGARSVAFFPLWDSAKERWFAGAFTWSVAPYRVLCPLEDLTYMASFGNTVMAEAARLSNLAISQMKTDFISSISHELRSPLHGILGSVEFLQDTDMSTMQIDMVNTIHSCGKTLLDTINHVLDFSKVNKKVKHHKTKRRKRRSEKGSKDRLDRRGSVVQSLEDVEDLCTISEEVVDSVYAGTSMSKRYPHVRGPHKHSPSNGSVIVPEYPPVQVIMDIQWRPNWNFEVDAGAWRRILMNIVSNALKYTDSGFVRLELGVQNDLTSRHGEPQSNVTITLTDSGKGISKEFLKHHLYTPFMQEDSLTSGTGLGLSIVKQIIYDIGGTIQITSERGTGTEVRVSLPLKPLRPSRSSRVPENLSILTDIREKTTGKKACLVAFDLLPKLGEEPTGILSAEDQAIIHLKSSMQGLFHDWFGMEIITAPNLVALPEASVYVVVESRLPKEGSLIESILAFSQKRQVQNKEPSAMLILGGSNSCGESNFTTRNRLHVRFLQQPYGPHKLGAALQEVFCEKFAQTVSQLPIREQTYDLDSAKHIDPTLHFPSKKRVQISCAIECCSQVAVDSHAEGEVKSNGIANGITDPVQAVPNPAELDRELTPQPPNEPIVPTDKHQIRRALLVEDNEINLKLLVIYMKKLKIDHVTAMNGLEALNSYKNANGQFDIILMDISMPVMDGITSARNIRKLELDNNYPAAAIIALTGAASMSARQEAFSAGIDLFLTKPVPMKYLQDLLGNLRELGREALMEEGM
ncbi:hypothetical protein B7463_g4830, partial [Scytalidium lignicola]